MRTLLKPLWVFKGVVSTPLLKKGIKSKATPQLDSRDTRMTFAILRTSKLKTLGNIGGSLSHNYRNRETLNADPDLSKLNEHSLENAEAVKIAINARLPEKRRSDAVLCVEHLITASPDWIGWGTDQETAFFEKSKKWLEQKYGAENVIATTIHRDETTPHLVAYVVPLDEKTGRLNCKKWLGGRAKLSSMQTDFAKEVKEFGLDRGVEGSKATHTTIKEHYRKLNEAEKTPEIDVELPELPAPDFFESKEKYAIRSVKFVVESIEGQIKAEWNRLRTLANEVHISRKEALEARKTVSSIRFDADTAIKEAKAQAERSVSYFKKEAADAFRDLKRIEELAKPYFDALHELREIEAAKIIIDSNLDNLKNKMLNEEEKRLEREKREARIKFEERFRLNWDDATKRMNKEQMAAYLYVHKRNELRHADDPAVLARSIKSLKLSIIENPDFAVNSFEWQSNLRNNLENERKIRDRGMDFDPFR